MTTATLFAQLLHNTYVHAGLAWLSSHAAHAGAALTLATAPVAGVDAGGGDDGDGGADDDADGAAAPAPSIADVGKAILAEMTEEERNRPIKGNPDGSPDDDDDDADDDEPEVPAKETKPAKEKKPEGEELEEIDEEQGLEGRQEKPAVDAAAGKGKPAAEGEGAGVKVTLPGLSDRGEEDIEVEVDPELAQRIQRLKNDGLRAKEFTARVTAIEGREAKMDAYLEAIEKDPISFHLSQMPVDQQIEVARALLLEHLDVLTPDIERWSDNEVDRLKALRERDKKMTTQSAAVETSRQVKLHARACISAAEKLIPEGTDPAVVKDFMADARQILGATAQRGEAFGPDDIPKLLERRVKLYKFDEAATLPPKKKPGAPAKPAAPSARPISEKAREVAERRKKPDAAATQQRIRRTQAARQAGSRVAPPGAGATATQASTLPQGADSDIRSMSKALRQHGLPDSWTPREE